MKFFAFLFVGVLVMLGSTSPSQAQDDSVFILDRSDSVEIEPTRRATLREFIVFPRMDSVLTDTGVVEFLLPGMKAGVKATVKTRRRIEELEGAQQISAQGDGYYLVITWSEEILQGFFTGPAGVFSISREGDEVRLRKRDTSYYGGDPAISFDREIKAVARSKSVSRLAEQKNVSQVATGTPQPLTLRVLFIYTPEAKTEIGGYGAMLGEIANAVTAANDTFDNSGLSWLEYEIAHSMQVPSSWGINEGTDAETLLTQMVDSIELDSERESRGGHLVHLLVDDLTFGGAPINGLARSNYDRNTTFPVLYDRTHYLNRETVSTSSVNTTATVMDFAHEAGHNLGMAHSVDEIPATFALRFGWFSRDVATQSSEDPDSRAHYLPGSMKSTVMSNAYLENDVDMPNNIPNNLCPNGCLREPNFSNSSVNFTGTSIPTGFPAPSLTVYGAENYRAPFETAYGISFLYPDVVLEKSFGNLPNCQYLTLPTLWDFINDDNNTMTQVTPGLNGTDCALEVATVGGYDEPNDDNSFVRDLFDDPDVDEFLSMHTLYYLDTSGLTQDNTLLLQKTKIHNIQCNNSLAGCPVTGVVQHKLMGRDGADGFQINIWFRGDLNPSTNKYRKIGGIFPLVLGENRIQTYARVGQYECTGVAIVWINGVRVYFDDELCNQDFYAGFSGATYGMIAPNESWISSRTGEALVFDEIRERRFGCAGPVAEITSCTP